MFTVKGEDRMKLGKQIQETAYDALYVWDELAVKMFCIKTNRFSGRQIKLSRYSQLVAFKQAVLCFD